MSEREDAEARSRAGSAAAVSETGDAPWARLEVLPGGGRRVRLGGRLERGWTGRLALGLSRLEVTIRRGYACYVSGGRCSAFFDIQALAGAPVLESIDFVALATEPGEPAVSAPVQLERYDLGPTIGGALQLSIQGRDCVGFLGSLLGHLAGLSLYPDELHVETYASVAKDRFRLRAEDGLTPTEELRRALDRRLAGWLVPAVPRPPWLAAF